MNQPRWSFFDSPGRGAAVFDASPRSRGTSSYLGRSKKTDEPLGLMKLSWDLIGINGI